MLSETLALHHAWCGLGFLLLFLVAMKVGTLFSVVLKWNQKPQWNRKLQIRLKWIKNVFIINNCIQCIYFIQKRATRYEIIKKLLKSSQVKVTLTLLGDIIVHFPWTRTCTHVHTHPQVERESAHTLFICGFFTDLDPNQMETFQLVL